MKKIFLSIIALVLFVGVGTTHSAASRLAELKQAGLKAVAAVKTKCFERQLELLDVPERGREAARIIARDKWLVPGPLYARTVLKQHVRPEEYAAHPKVMEEKSQKKFSKLAEEAASESRHLTVTYHGDICYCNDESLNDSLKQEITYILKSFGVARPIVVVSHAELSSKDMLLIAENPDSGEIVIFIDPLWSKTLSRDVLSTDITCGSDRDTGCKSFYSTLQLRHFHSALYHEMGHFYHHHMFVTFKYKGPLKDKMATMRKRIDSISPVAWAGLGSGGALICTPYAEWASWLVGIGGGSAITVSVAGMASLLLPSYLERYAECEADSFVVQKGNLSLLRAKKDFFEKLNSHEKRAHDQKWFDKLSSHPTDKERAKFFDREIKHLEQQEAAKKS